MFDIIKSKGGVMRDLKAQTFDAKDVATYFVWKSNQEKKDITNKKIQKLLYYAQAWSLVLKNKPLFGENIEAWIHGPTVRDVYSLYKKYGFGPIRLEVAEKDIAKLKTEKDLLDTIWRVYGKFDADYLEELTHNEEPWIEARQGLEGNIASTNVIPQETMKAFYGRRLAESRKSS